MQQVIQKCVARSIGAEGDLLALKTEISREKSESLKTLHRMCDWVITLDRNAGIEYFDSPGDGKESKEIYDAYVIDCVPEREDLGCLQLITSTSNLEEVRYLLDVPLDQMGLSVCPTSGFMPPSDSGTRHPFLWPSRLSIRWIIANLTNASDDRTLFSRSLLNRRHLPSHANVRSTVHRIGSSTSPRHPSGVARWSAPTLHSFRPIRRG